MPNSVTANPHVGAGAAVATSRRSVYMVVVCTMLAGAAQILLKFGALHPMPRLGGDTGTWMPFAWALLGNVPLLVGYTLHAANAALLILALRGGELSMLYPIYALSYVWVALLSIYFFHDSVNFWKSAGIALVIAGVAYMGRASSQS